MKVQERDELLIRIDERVRALKDGDEGDVPEIIKHLKQLNGNVRTNTVWRRVIVGIGGSWLTAITYCLINFILGG